MSIQPISPLTPLEAIKFSDATSLEAGKPVVSKVEEGAQKASTDFAKFFSDALSEVGALQEKGESASLALATGQVQDLSEVMVALEKASLSLSLAVSTRDKALEAYNQIMRMQI
ncbi:flagellar hook-basal body complex protein FliE [Desulfosporosinus orientis DSM 765]|uniref:Flagellar hook-basal body complex protein FliE n=1 Tax=Desulfosporosinus orientis (strain ATCC 19365 / DSM 765 / NCIMB 8382 / VKM B-1628 / Singapore I) TaxID=768706 RepID=G7WHZ5_DESOD|nr:flagellar hook-basal body complex protein FliE [Desulfosporosinus orientis]AET70292.1 flagellar hook-basal body complex protein FliE [Desulfosporosinus orientis DSM 765]